MNRVRFQWSAQAPAARKRLRLLRTLIIRKRIEKWLLRKRIFGWPRRMLASNSAHTAPFPLIESLVKLPDHVFQALPGSKLRYESETLERRSSSTLRGSALLAWAETP